MVRQHPSAAPAAAAPHLARSFGRQGALVLDAGGGTGATGGWMTEYAPTVLADFEPMALDVARDEHDPLRPVLADLNHLPFADDSFDVVLCVTALCHRMNPDPAAIVERLRPGHATGRRGLHHGARWQAAVARPRRGDAHRTTVQRRRAGDDGVRSRARGPAIDRCVQLPGAARRSARRRRAGRAEERRRSKRVRARRHARAAWPAASAACCAGSICRSACRRSRSRVNPTDAVSDP